MHSSLSTLHSVLDYLSYYDRFVFASYLHIDFVSTQVRVSWIVHWFSWIFRYTIFYTIAFSRGHVNIRTPLQINAGFQSNSSRSSCGDALVMWLTWVDCFIRTFLCISLAVLTLFEGLGSLSLWTQHSPHTFQCKHLDFIASPQLTANTLFD